MRPYLRLCSRCSGVAAGLAACSDSAYVSERTETRIAAPSDRPSLDYNWLGSFLGLSHGDVQADVGRRHVQHRRRLLHADRSGERRLLADELLRPGHVGSRRARRLAPASRSRSRRHTASQSTGPVVDFSPALRFSPNAQVTLSTSLYCADSHGSARGYFAQNPSALALLRHVLHAEPRLDRS